MKSYETAKNIIDGIESLIEASHDMAKEKGWWDNEDVSPRSIGDQFSNFHSELSEAWEEYRNHGIHGDGGDKVIYTVDGKPEGLVVELADCLIRIFDTCGRYNLPLADALILKLTYNKTRTHRHGGKLA